MIYISEVFGLVLKNNHTFFQPCTVSTMAVGDGIDNDCDGKIDEELCTLSNNYAGKLFRNTYTYAIKTIKD